MHFFHTYIIPGKPSWVKGVPRTDFLPRARRLAHPPPAEQTAFGAGRCTRAQRQSGSPSVRAACQHRLPVPSVSTACPCRLSAPSAHVACRHHLPVPPVSTVCPCIFVWRQRAARFPQNDPPFWKKASNARACPGRGFAGWRAAAGRHSRAARELGKARFVSGRNGDAAL